MRLISPAKSLIVPPTPKTVETLVASPELVLSAHTNSNIKQTAREMNYRFLSELVFPLKSKHREGDTVERFDVAVAAIDGEAFMRRIYGFDDVLIGKLEKLELIVELEST